MLVAVLCPFLSFLLYTYWEGVMLIQSLDKLSLLSIRRVLCKGMSFPPKHFLSFTHLMISFSIHHHPKTAEVKQKKKTQEKH